MKRRRPLSSFARDARGAAAVELALVLPAFVTLAVGVIYTAQLIFEYSSLCYATERAARCASLDTSVCSGATAIQAFAATTYKGPSYPAPTFTSSTAACGHRVTGQVTFSLSYGMGAVNVPLSSAACFP